MGKYDRRLDIIKRRIAGGRPDDPDRFMDAASASAQRAPGLTARLLGFSRRQSLDAKPVDMNALTASLEDWLRRTINESIALHIVPDEMVARWSGGGRWEACDRQPEYVRSRYDKSITSAS